MALLSMTGFGRAEETTVRGRYVAEVRTLNNRFLDINLRLSSGLGAFDLALRETIRAAVSRGKVDGTLRWEPAEAIAGAPRIVRYVLDGLLAQLEDVRRQHLTAAPISLVELLRVPGVVQEPAQGADGDPKVFEAVGGDLDSVLGKALDALRVSRAKEGQALHETLCAQLAVLRAGLEGVEGARESVVQRYRERLAQRAAELLRGSETPVEPGRLEFEIAMFADKADLKEEVDRLGAHLKTFADTLERTDAEPVGRALDFLVQEILREVNTIGSKCRDLEIGGRVLAMKSAVESIREQVQNLE